MKEEKHKIVILLDDKQYRLLRIVAKREGMTPDEFAVISIKMNIDVCWFINKWRRKAYRNEMEENHEEN